MSILENDFLNYVLMRTQSQAQDEMATLIKNHFAAEHAGHMTQSDVIEYLTSLFAMVKPEAVGDINDVMDANGNIIPENHYMMVPLAA
ncbi:hypothetical protein [Schleiferilactobacillus perolens]|uniref:Uncharacterized protein n=1 Tax=Schleiferilactobacillus perolens DSM 12744 TaxID=1423792 RepID=A0A0R1N416_9LACO|nr:hypothetical protein [Schleiferilactobacillus perolens]KRL10776.1 hypothetical protein FD09_GL000922 [Schleiferilactobacillus perolens DSM 12744]